jgi:hypothetical protein
MNHSRSSQDGQDVVPSVLRRIAHAESPREVAGKGAGPPPEQRGEPSMDSSHVSALQLKHAGIERQIHDELCRPIPDAAMIQALKKRKLRIKEEISRH